MKQKKKLALALALCIDVTQMPAVYADEDYSDTAYWTELCTGDNASDNKDACQGFLDYMTSQSDSLESTISGIDDQREEVSANIEEYAALIEQYQNEIDDLNTQIEDLQTKIDEKQKEIEEKEDEVAVLRDRVGQQVENTQPTMRLSRYFDILMGAKTLTNFLRIANGLSDITEYSENNLTKLNQLIFELNKAKDELTASQNELKTKQEEVLAKQYEAEMIQEEYKKQEAELVAQRAAIVSNIDEIQGLMEEINDALGTITASPGWTYPVPGVKMTPGAGTWNYASGGRHYGEDFGYGVVYGESYAVAAANGVVLMANDAGCGYGHIGDYCPVVGGGNEILLLVNVNGSSYGVKYYHLMTGTFGVQTGDLVSAGDYLAKVGSSGNSTGPHCHICVYYLGSSDNFAYYAQSWNGDMAMNTGWNTYSERICENGASAPCKVKPESVFGTGW